MKTILTGKLIGVLIIGILFFNGISLSKNNAASDTVNYNYIKNGGRYLLTKFWKYHPGDNPDWANPVFNDSSWNRINTDLFDNDSTDVDWSNIGWFRLELEVDSAALNTPLGFIIYQSGASEVYLNGKIISSNGIVSKNTKNEKIANNYEPKPLTLLKNKNTLAVRFSNHRYNYLKNLSDWTGFVIYVGEYEELSDDYVTELKSTSIKRTSFISVSLILALIHFFLFLFNRNQKQNLYYVFFLLSFTLFIYGQYHELFIADKIFSILLYRLLLLVLILTVYFGSLTAYTIYQKPPRYYLYLFFIGLILSVWWFISPSRVALVLSYIFISVVSYFTLGILFKPLKVVQPNRRIIQIGFIIMSILGIYQMLLAFRIVPPVFGMTDFWIYGVIAFIISMSVSLAKDFSDTSKNLKLQLKEVKELSQKTLEQERIAKQREIEKKLLEVDNRRKTEELKEARKLQLSMLPEKIPVIQNIELAAYMQPATEVGGDFYDFRNQNGSISIVIGDATGHGIKAGIMVSVFKSLFSSDIVNSNIPEFFNHSTEIIKRMNLGNLFMAATLMKIKGKEISISSAGMPPVMIYKTEQNEVQEKIIKGMPLGAFNNYPYEEHSFILSSNDIILLMSDGLIELFNKKKEQFGTNRIESILQTYNNQNPENIIKKLVAAGEEWRGESPQNDDITFLVLKVK